MHRKEVTLEEYIAVGLENLRLTSRTVIDGNIDVSSVEDPIPEICVSAFAKWGLTSIPPLCKEEFDKLNLDEKQLIELVKSNEKVASLDIFNLKNKSRNEIKQLALDNYVKAMEVAHAVSQKNSSFSKPADVKEFIKNIAVTLGKGIINEKNWLREHDSTKYPVYTKVKDLNNALDNFSIQFLKKYTELLATKNVSVRLKKAKDFSAWIEYRVNLTDHFIADSCGKTAALLSNFVFMGADIHPENMPHLDRKRYFNKAILPETRRGMNPDIEAEEYERWRRYYCSEFFIQPIKEKVDAWSIPSPSIKQHLKGLEYGVMTIPLDTEFTHFRNAIRDKFVIAEMSAASGNENIYDLITYKLNNMVLFETTIIAETEVKLASENELPHSVKNIYRCLKPKLLEDKEITQQFQQQARLLAEDALDNPGSPFYQFANKTYKKIMARHISGEYKLLSYLHRIEDNKGEEIHDNDLRIKQITLWIVADKIYQEKIEKYLMEVYEPRIQNKIDELQYKRLSLHKGEKRHTFMLAGAPGTGKSSIIIKKIIEKAEKLGINWDDVVKVSTDIHRIIVDSYAFTSEYSHYSSLLNHAEALYISKKVYQRIANKIAKGQAPHVLIDAVDISEERLKLGIAELGNLHITVTTTPADVALDRVYNRAKHSNRFAPTAYQLTKHREISHDFFKQLMPTLNSRTEVILYDKNISEDKDPLIIMKADMQQRLVTVFDSDKLAEFLKKAKVNITAKNKKELFFSKNNIFNNYEKLIEDAGFWIYKPQKINLSR